MFRNLRFYRVFEPWPRSEVDLSERLAERAFTPCSAYSEKSAGWEPPVEQAEALLCRRIDNADLLQLRVQSRVLPPAAVGEALADRLAEYRQRTGEDPSPGERRRLKEEVRDELLPRSLLKSRRTRACFIASESMLAIDAVSPSRAEEVIDQLRPCFGRFQCKPLEFRTSPGELIRRIFLGEKRNAFALGSECRLQDPSDRQAVGTWRNVDLADEAIRRHVHDGMHLTHLGIVFNGHVGAVLSDDGVVGKLEVGLGAEKEEAWEEDPLARLDADFALLSGSVHTLLRELKQQLGGYAE